MNTEMKANEMKLDMNELEQANGGNFLDDIKDILKKIIPNPFAPKEPLFPNLPENPVIADEK